MDPSYGASLLFIWFNVILDEVGLPIYFCGWISPRGLMAATVIAALSASAPFPGCHGGTLSGCPGTQNCTTHALTQNIDHFDWAPPLGNSSATTFEQRYFVNDQWWDKTGGGPVFFYFGNEDDVELYVNHTGLMWESAAEFKALLVFGEHRYYGKSLPYAPGTQGCMNFLTTEQAMADFAYLIDHLREAWGADRSAIVGFGGSYGGARRRSHRSSAHHRLR